VTEVLSGENPEGKDPVKKLFPISKISRDGKVVKFEETDPCNKLFLNFNV